MILVSSAIFCLASVLARSCFSPAACAVCSFQAFHPCTPSKGHTSYGPFHRFIETSSSSICTMLESFVTECILEGMPRATTERRPEIRAFAVPMRLHGWSRSRTRSVRRIRDEKESRKAFSFVEIAIGSRGYRVKEDDC